MRLNTLIRRVERLGTDMPMVVRAACEEESGWIVSANRGQLADGRNVDGVLMNGGRYSEVALENRSAVGLPIDHVYLIYTGRLQSEMYVVYTDSGFAIKSRDWKQRLVEEAALTGYWNSSGYESPRYGAVFGLTSENKGLLGNRIQAKIVKTIKRRLSI